jgi:hypothetical protein
MEARPSNEHWQHLLMSKWSHTFASQTANLHHIFRLAHDYIIQDSHRALNNLLRSCLWHKLSQKRLEACSRTGSVLFLLSLATAQPVSNGCQDAGHLPKLAVLQLASR